MRHVHAASPSFFVRSGPLRLACCLALAALCSVGFVGCGMGLSENTSELAPLPTFLRWNKIATDASAADHGTAKEQFGPCRSARALAIVHIAMFETLVKSNGGYSSYVNVPNPGGGVSQSIAIAKAARDTLASLFPAQTMTFDDALALDLEEVEDGSRKTNGLTLGQSAASAILGTRFGDGAQVPDPIVGFDYFPGIAPGEWRPDPVSGDPTALGGNWGQVVPFSLASGDQFRAAPPPDLSSYEYAIAYLDGKAVGGDGITTPTLRTPSQTVSGLFWAYDGAPGVGSVPRLYNQLAVAVGTQRGLSTMEFARLIVLVNVAMADAAVACWDSKYYYAFWNPILGIRESDPGTGPSGIGDNNVWTAGDLGWTPLGAQASNTMNPDFTPPTPAYPCGHATLGGAIFQVMRRFFGTNSVDFTLVSDELNGLTLDNTGNPRPLIPRSFINLSTAENDNAASRVYLGVQWEFDSAAGMNQGHAVGDWIFDHVYQPTP